MSRAAAPIQLDELLDLAAYEEARPAVRRSAIAARALRRVAVGPSATLSFENRETLRYQVQEMLRAERIVEPRLVAEEAATYSELLPGPDSLSATLMLEFEPPGRDELLRRLVGLDEKLCLEIEGHGRAAARFDERQMDGERLSSIQFVRFALSGGQLEALEGGAALEVVVEHPAYPQRARVSPGTIRALAGDLREAEATVPGSGVASGAVPEAGRSHVSDEAMLLPALEARLCEGVELRAMADVARWCLAASPTPDGAAGKAEAGALAAALAEDNDRLAARVIARGGSALATARRAARISRLPELADAPGPAGLLACLRNAMAAHLESLYRTRALAARLDETETVRVLDDRIVALARPAA